jgi:hypothetical protein
VQASSEHAFELDGALAFAPAKTDQYLMAYSSAQLDGSISIWGRALAADGTPMAKDFPMSTQTGQMSKPVIAYNPSTQRFLVVWSRKLYNESRAELTGLTVGLDGKIVGQEFTISMPDLFNQRPAIAYCPGRDRFLVTWTRGTDYDFQNGTADIYGQFVADDAVHLQGNNFVIAAAAKNQFKSDVTCDVAHDNFMVVWEDQRNAATQDDIYGQLMASDGTMIGGNFPISTTSNVERRPVIAANKDGNYVVVWESVIGSTSTLVSQALDSTGHVLGQPLPIGADLGGSRNRPAISYLKTQNVFLVVWDNSAFNGVSDGIYGQFLESNGALRQTDFPMTTAGQEQYRPHLAAARDTFLAVWTDFRDTNDPNAKRHVYEYYGRVIGNDMPLSARWRNPQSK